MDIFKKQVKETANKLLLDLKSNFIPTPTGTCDCAKPVVFVGNSKKFKCTRCGSEWKLVVQIVQTKKPTIEIE